jgi:hypothetical protein
MVIHFLNYQDKRDPNHGRAISNEDELAILLDQARKARPFIAEFCSPSDFHLTIGIGGNFGCVQHSRVDGDLPYLMAVFHNPPMNGGCIDFLCGGTPTPIRAKNILSFDELKQILLHFMKTGERSDAVSWESI